mgnify:CR=1 FL=1
MGKKVRNPDEYVFYEGIDNINLHNITYDDDDHDNHRKFTKYDNLSYVIDNENIEEETEINSNKKIIDRLKSLFDDTKNIQQTDKFEDLIFNKNNIITTEEEFRQKNFKDFLELKYETNLPTAYSDSSLIPSEFLQPTNEKVQIHDDPSKSTGNNKHRATVLIKKDKDENIKGIQVICICGERINISFDYDSNDTNTQSEYEEQSLQE